MAPDESQDAGPAPDLIPPGDKHLPGGSPDGRFVRDSLDDFGEWTLPRTISVHHGTRAREIWISTASGTPAIRAETGGGGDQEPQRSGMIYYWIGTGPGSAKERE